MKIKFTEIEIVADARELRESQTLAQNFTSMLSRCFKSTEEFDDVEETKEGESDGLEADDPQGL